MTPPRRWSFRFSLRTMLVGVLIVAVPGAWIASELNIVRQRERAAAMFRGRGLRVHTCADHKPVTRLAMEGAMPWWRRMMGDTYYLYFEGADDDPELDRIRENLFPEAAAHKVLPGTRKWHYRHKPRP